MCGEATPDVVLFVDAVDHGAPPGDWIVAEPSALGARGADTHAPSLRLLAGLLGSRGVECWLLGVQPGLSVFGEGLTPAVADGVEELARALAAALDREVARA